MKATKRVFFFFIFGKRNFGKRNISIDNSSRATRRLRRACVRSLHRYLTHREPWAPRAKMRLKNVFPQATLRFVSGGVATIPKTTSSPTTTPRPSPPLQAWTTSLLSAEVKDEELEEDDVDKTTSLAVGEECIEDGCVECDGGDVVSPRGKGDGIHRPHRLGRRPVVVPERYAPYDPEPKPKKKRKQRQHSVQETRGDEVQPRTRKNRKKVKPGGGAGPVTMAPPPAEQAPDEYMKSHQAAASAKTTATVAKRTTWVTGMKTSADTNGRGGDFKKKSRGPSASRVTSASSGRAPTTPTARTLGVR